MLVRDRMTHNPTTVTPETTFDIAFQLMRDRKIRRFPVVNPQGRVVGIVSEKDLLNVAPSPATTLERHELHALLGRLTIAEVMTRGVIVVEPDVPLEEAERVMADNKIGGLPVVDAQHKLAGIITETDIFRTMVEMLGARRKGIRLTFRVEEHRGMLAELASEVARQGGNIITVGVFQGDDQQHPVIVIKVENGDEERLIGMLRGKGAELLDVRKI